MIDREKLSYVIDKLIKKDFNHPLACQVLEQFEHYAEDIRDYDTLGELSIVAKDLNLRLRAAEYTYSHARTSEELFHSRENLYKTYNMLNYPEKALFYIDLNLQEKPGDTDTLMNRAFNLALLGKREESEKILTSIITDDPKQKDDLEYVLSGAQLRAGDTARGIRNFITKFKPENKLFRKTLDLEFWDGGVQPGRTIVINGEGGVGDEIINIRFLDWFKKHDMKPILYSSWNMYRPDIVDLFRRHGHDVVTKHWFFKEDYLWTHMMALPAYMNLTEAELWTGPYLTPLRAEKNRLQDSNFKIGIKCNGNPYFDQDIYRRIPLDDMVAAMPKNASIYYFDKERSHPDCINLRDRLDTWEDTLDYIDQMDVIVSSCTSLVHAAGAMGKRTIVLVPIAEYYVWTSTRQDETTPWYGDNLSVIKQSQIRSWARPLARARELIDQQMQND